MAGWLERGLCCGLVWAASGAVMANSSLPAASAENAAPSPVRAGLVPGGNVTPAAMEAAVRVDAGRMWPQTDPKALRVSVEDVVWSDGSLGCPRPGMAYTQALVPGWRLVVGDGRVEAVYHASHRGQWLLCPGRSGPAPLPRSVTR